MLLIIYFLIPPCYEKVIPSKLLFPSYFACLASYLLLFFSLGSSFAQSSASGNLSFNTSGGTESLSIDVVATSLFDNGSYVYNLSGKTNSDLSFNAWALESSLSVDEFDLLSKYGYVVFNNPGSSLNALVSVTDVYNVAAKVYDMKGRLVSIPVVVPNGEHSVILSDPLSNVGDGIYFVLIGGSGNTACELPCAKSAGLHISNNFSCLISLYLP